MNIEIMKIYKESFQNVGSHKAEWMKVAFGPLLILVLSALLLWIAYVQSGFTFEINQTTGEFKFFYESASFLISAATLYGIVYFIAVVSLSINGYRYAVLQEGGDRWLTFNLNIRFVKMVLYGILVGILAGIYGSVSAGIVIGAQALFDNGFANVILGTLFALYGFYLIFRITLYPVVISIDQGEPLRTSWHLMKGNVLRFIGLIILVTITLMIIGSIGGAIMGVLGYLLHFVSPLLSSIPLILFGVFMFLFSWAINSKVMGFVYQELSTK